MSYYGGRTYTSSNNSFTATRTINNGYTSSNYTPSTSTYTYTSGNSYGGGYESPESIPKPQVCYPPPRVAPISSSSENVTYVGQGYQPQSTGNSAWNYGGNRTNNYGNGVSTNNGGSSSTNWESSESTGSSNYVCKGYQPRKIEVYDNRTNSNFNEE